MTQGFALYTDGGCRPNPGRGGWGVHGYLYSLEKPKRGTGNSDHVLTNDGYMLKAEYALLRVTSSEDEAEAYSAYEAAVGVEQKPIEITPIHYVDGWGSFIEDVTNNIAEVVAATNGLRHAAEYADVSRVRVWTDSEYVSKNVNEGHLERWAATGWLTRDYQPVKNQEHWQCLLDAILNLRQRGVTVEFRWIKGHNDLLGNEKADRLATAAVMVSRLERETRVEIQTSEAQGYWKYDSDKHPFLANRRMYFNTMEGFNEPGVYYLGEHGKEDEWIGKRMGTGAFSVIRLETPDPVVELVREFQCQMSRNIDSLMVMRLDKLFSAETHRQITSHGKFGLVQSSSNRLDLNCLDEEPLTKELRPAKIALRAIATASDLSERLDLFLENSDEVTVTDLTPILYETVVSVDKKDNATTSTKLKAEYNVGYATLKVDAAYKTDTAELAVAPVVLTLGIDLLDRNALKRLEDRHPKVSLITWKEAPDAFRYATVVQAGNDTGIWTGAYSNLRVLVPAA